MNRIIYPLGFLVFLALWLILLFWASSAFAEEDNCIQQGDVKICSFTKENSPACHDTGEFRNIEMIAEFYGAEPLGVRVIPQPGGLLLFNVGIEMDRPTEKMRYILSGIREAPNVPFDLCITTIMTKPKGDPA